MDGKMPSCASLIFWLVPRDSFGSSSLFSFLVSLSSSRLSRWICLMLQRSSSHGGFPSPKSPHPFSRWSCPLWRQEGPLRAPSLSSLFFSVFLVSPIPLPDFSSWSHCQEILRDIVMFEKARSVLFSSVPPPLSSSPPLVFLTYLVGIRQDPVAWFRYHRSPSRTAWCRKDVVRWGNCLRDGPSIEGCYFLCAPLSLFIFFSLVTHTLSLLFSLSLSRSLALSLSSFKHLIPFHLSSPFFLMFR